MIVDRVEVVTEVRILLRDTFIGVPLIKFLADILTAYVKHGFGVGTSLLLQAPGCRVVEVQTTSTWTATALLEVVADVDARVCFGLLPHAVRVFIVVPNRASHHRVFNRILLNISLGKRRVTANSDVNNHVRVVVNDLHALLNGCIQVNIPNGTTIHEDISF